MSKLLEAGCFYISTNDFRMGKPGIIYNDISDRRDIVKLPWCLENQIVYVKSITRRIKGRYIVELVIDFKEFEAEFCTQAMQWYLKKII